MADRIETDLLVKAVTEGFDKVNANVKGLGDSFEKQQSKTSIAEKALAAFSAALVGLNQGLEVAMKVVKGFKAAFDFTDQGAQLLRMEESGQSLAASMGSDMNDVVRALDKAAMGAVDYASLTQSASRAMMLGVSSDAEQLANLMEVASFRGRAMGLSTTQAFSDIVTGVGRMSPLILDNLGIVIDADTTYAKYAESINKAASELTSAEKRQALLTAVLKTGNEQIAKAGGLAADSATQFEKFKANIKNVSDSVKKDLAPAMESVLKVMNDRFDEEKELLEVGEMAARKNLEVAKSYDEYKAGVRRALEAQGLFVTETEDGLQVFRDQQTMNANLTESFGVLGLAEYDAAKASQYAGEINRQHAEYLRQMQAGASGAADAMNSLQGALGEVNGKLAEYNVNQLTRDAIETELKLASGEMTEADLEREKALGGVTLALQNGAITQSEYIAMVQQLYGAGQDAAGIIQLMGTFIDGLPESKRIAIYVDVYGIGNGDLGELLGLDSDTTDKPFDNGNAWESHQTEKDRLMEGGASGLSMIVPSGFPNDSYTVGATSGEHVSISRSGAANANYSQATLESIDAKLGTLGKEIRDAILIGVGK